MLIVQRRDPPNFFFERLDPERHLADSRLLTRGLRRSRLVILDGASMMTLEERDGGNPDQASLDTG